jgi:hypothetical protein
VCLTACLTRPPLSAYIPVPTVGEREVARVRRRFLVAGEIDHTTSITLEAHRPPRAPNASPAGAAARAITSPESSRSSRPSSRANAMAVPGPRPRCLRQRAEPGSISSSLSWPGPGTANTERAALTRSMTGQSAILWDRVSAENRAAISHKLQTVLSHLAILVHGERHEHDENAGDPGERLP